MTRRVGRGEEVTEERIKERMERGYEGMRKERRRVGDKSRKKSSR